MVRQRVTIPWQDSEPIERMGLRKSPPKHAALRLLICAVKKIGMGRRTWRSQKSKAPRTRLDSKKSAKSYETDCREGYMTFETLLDLSKSLLGNANAVGIHFVEPLNDGANGFPGHGVSPVQDRVDGLQ